MTEDEHAAVERVSKLSGRGALIAVMYYLGLRRGEALGLKWGYFDWNINEVHVQRDIDYAAGSSGAVGDLKSNASNRTIPLPNDLIEILSPLRADDASFVFRARGGKSLSASSFLREWVKLVVECGFATPVKRDPEKAKDVRFEWEYEITPHYLRHDYITRLFEAGIDPIIIMRLAGHADYRTSANVYTHVSTVKLHEAVKKLAEPRFGKKVAEKLPEELEDL